MKKLWMVLLVLALLLAACGGGGTDPSVVKPGVSDSQGVWDKSNWEATTWQ